MKYDFNAFSLTFFASYILVHDLVLTLDHLVQCNYLHFISFMYIFILDHDYDIVRRKCLV